MPAFKFQPPTSGLSDTPPGDPLFDASAPAPAPATTATAARLAPVPEAPARQVDDALAKVPQKRTTQAMKPVAGRDGNSLLVVLQFFHREIARVERVLALFARSPAFRTGKARLVLAPRADTDIPAAAKREGFAATFPGFEVIRPQNYAVGWPAGPNALWQGAVKELLRRKFDEKVILFTEPDTIPLVSHWVEALLKVWASSAPAKIVGAGKTAMTDDGEERFHINGNCLMSADREFLRKLASIDIPRNRAWDVFIARTFEHESKSVKQIRNDWKIPTVDSSDLREMVDEGVVLHHGAKDDSVIDYASESLI